MLHYSLLLFFLWAIDSANAVPVILPQPPTAEERTFAADLQNALETTNISALASLSYCEGDEPWAVSFYFHQFLRHPCDMVRLVRSGSAEMSNYSNEPIEPHSALPVQWFVVLRQPPLQYEATGTNLTVLPASLHNGKIVITRRMVAFSPQQKRLIVLAGGLAMLAAIWYASKCLRLRSTGKCRYAPAALAVLLVCFAAECWIVTHAMASILPYPARLFVLPGVGLLAFFVALVYDSWSESGQTASSRLKAAGPLIVFFEGWKAWKERTGPFVSPGVRSAVYVAVTMLVVWFGIYVSRGLSIVLSPRHVQGVVIKAERRGGIYYEYSVNGRRYTGSGVGNFDRYYPVGSPVDVKYSGLHPANSTIDDDPFLLVEQLACGIAIFTGIAVLANAKKRK